MTHHSDSLWMGPAKTNIKTDISSGGLGFGPMGRVYVQDIVPQTANVSNLALNQTLGSAATLTLTAGSGVTQTTFQGNTVYQLDVPRGIKITSLGNDSGATFTVAGYDKYGASMTQALAGGSSASVSTLKAFSMVASVKISTASASQVTVGTSDTFGFDLAIADPCYIDPSWASSFTAIDQGTLKTAVVATATVSTGDVRGTYQPSSASNGSRRLVVQVSGSSSQFGLTSTVAAIIGVPQV